MKKVTIWPVWIALVWLVVLTVAIFDAINENEHLRQKADALQTKQIGWAFDAIDELRKLVVRPADSVKWTWGNDWSALTYYYPTRDSTLPEISECTTAIMDESTE